MSSSAGDDARVVRRLVVRERKDGAHRRGHAVGVEAEVQIDARQVGHRDHFVEVGELAHQQRHADAGVEDVGAASKR